MNCETFRDQALDFLQGTLQGNNPDFDAHRRSCSACAGALRGIEMNEQVIRAARVPTAPADLWPRIAAALGEDRVVPFRKPWKSALTAAAAALVVAIGLFAVAPVRKAPTLNLIVHEVGPESQRTFRALVPRYEDVDTATAMVDTFFRND